MVNGAPREKRPPAPFYDLEINDIPADKSPDSQPNKELAELLKNVKPDWDLNKLKFKTFTNGITNKIFRVSCQGDKEKLVLRIFGQNSSKIINRDDELENFDLLSRYGLGTPVLARFANGILCGYLEGECLSVESIRDPKIVEKICAALAKMHKIPNDSNKSSEPFICTKIREYFDVLPDKYEPEKQKIYDEYFEKNGVDLKEDFRLLLSKIQSLNEESRRQVFCHNDLLIYNILFDSKSDKIHFIDYEYAGNNFQLFDIANHFCEYAGVNEMDYSLCPDEAEKRVFLENYLRNFLPKEQNGQNDLLERLLVDLPVFEATSHLFWSVWGLAQAHLSSIDFDYMSYATLRHKQFRKFQL